MRTVQSEPGSLGENLQSLDFPLLSCPYEFSLPTLEFELLVRPYADSYGRSVRGRFLCLLRTRNHRRISNPHDDPQWEVRSISGDRPQEDRDTVFVLWSCWLGLVLSHVRRDSILWFPILVFDLDRWRSRRRCFNRPLRENRSSGVAASRTVTC